MIGGIGSGTWIRSAEGIRAGGCDWQNQASESRTLSAEFEVGRSRGIFQSNMGWGFWAVPEPFGLLKSQLFWCSTHRTVGPETCCCSPRLRGMGRT